MPPKLIEGVFAAVLTPRDKHGHLDEVRFVGIFEYLLAHGVQGFAINGATGEFCLTTPAELDRLAELTAKTIGPDRRFVVGIGTASVHLSSSLAGIAAENGAAACLVPPPFFFPYEQGDLAAFFLELADRSTLPLLLYNLPQFTSPLKPGTVIQLLTGHRNIIGIKDSSGSLDTLRAVTTSCPSSVCRIVGSDGALIPARDEGLSDGVISGVACVLPALIQRVQSGSPSSESDCERLEQFLDRLAPFPTPWGLKWIAEELGLADANFGQSLTPDRLAQGRTLQQWFRGWHKE